jgi:mRNA-degrading endonuclease toxin of MazEF toxin-antitoxin module
LTRDGEGGAGKPLAQPVLLEHVAKPQDGALIGQTAHACMQMCKLLGDVLVAPITQGGDFARYAGFAVSLTGTGLKTQGVALINKIRMLDLVARNAKKIETVPQEVMDDALGRLAALFED